MEFSYKAKDTNSKTIKGVVEADTQDKAVSLLKERGLFVVSIREGKGWEVDLSDVQFWGKVSQKEVTVFTRQLSTMINAGLPINDALFALKEQVSP